MNSKIKLRVSVKIVSLTDVGVDVGVLVGVEVGVPVGVDVGVWRQVEVK